METQDEIIKKLQQQAESRVSLPSLEDANGLAPSDIQALLHDLQVYQVELEIQNEELRSTQQTLLAAKDKYARLYDYAPVGYCTLSAKAIILECNATLCDLLGRGRDRLLHYHLGHFLDNQDLTILNHMLKQNDGDIDHTICFKDSSGKPIHTQLRLHRIDTPMEEGKAIWLATITDINDLYRISMELKVKGRAIETTMEGVMISNRNNEICYVNPAFEETTGYSREQVIGKQPSLLQSGKHTKTFYREMWNTLHNEGRWRGAIWNRRADGELYPEWLSISTIYDEQRKPIYYVGVFSDITREEDTRKRLHSLAYFDGVTSLPNRHLFLDRLTQEIAHARRDRSQFVLLFMDLDRFKIINDTLGHSVGDLLLVAVGKRLTKLLRENDTVARMGGDEFMMLLPGVKSRSDANLLAEKVLETMTTPFDLEGHQYHVSISIGISHYPDHGLDAETLIKHADIAMYQAKARGKNTYFTYSNHLNHKLENQLDLENDLRNALIHNQLQLHYQPQWNIASGCWSGVEALLRWEHPTQGMIPPSRFIPLAEETGLIVKIGYWVLRTAAQQYLTWKESGIDIGLLAINLSPHQFLQSNLVEHITDILKQTGMPPEQLCIEITESAAMPNFDYSIRTLKALREKGITISIDDFGSGFSSLSHLRHLPIDVLKIDRQFIDEIPGNPDDVAIAQSIIAMANALNLEIVAEGVENEGQLQFLREHDCHCVQGFLFSKPIPPCSIPKLFS